MKNRTNMKCYRNISIKILVKILLVLCLATLIGLLFAEKDQIVNKILPRRNDSHKRTDLIEGNIRSREIEQLVRTTQDSGTSLQPKAATTTPSPKPTVKFKPSSMVIRKTTSVTHKLQNMSIKPPKDLGLFPTKTSNMTTKPRKASTTKSMKKSTNASQRFTTFNYLGDKYGTDDTYVNSSCPFRARDRLRGKAFREIYLEKIPVLQWKKHAQMSEYERLKKYSGAQGWMEVTWEIINETLNLMNSTGNAYLFDTWKGQSRCIRCAVVGNGGILNGSGMGQEIDSHDYVFRVNGAITKGFENDVGNRTSFFLFSTNTLMNSLVAYKKEGFKSVPRTPETRYIVLPDHERDYLLVRSALTNTIIDRGTDKDIKPSEYFGKNLTAEHFKILHPDFMRYLRNRFLYDPILETTIRDMYRPSTGASMLLTAIHTCDQVNAYGFMTPNYEKFSNHYFDITHQQVAFYANHNFLSEMELWQKLHNAGAINLYMRDGDGGNTTIGMHKN